LVKCPYCGYEAKFRLLKSWRFRFYDVKMLECPNCGGRFNNYLGVTSRGRRSEYVIRIKPRPVKRKSV